MKRSIGLIVLLAFSGGWSVAHLITQNSKFATIEQDVKSTLKDLYITLNDNPILEHIPDWAGEAAIVCAKHYQVYGVTFFHVKTWLYLLTLVAVILMFFWKKSGFYLYLTVQVGSMLAIFLAFGLNSGSLFMAVLSALLSLIMLKLYKNLFLAPLSVAISPNADE